MKVLPKFPVYASGNCDFVTKRTKIEADDKIIVLDVAAEVLPTGTLCMHSSTVKTIVAKLGWELQTDESRQELIQARRDLAHALEQLDAYADLLAALDRAFKASDDPAPASVDAHADAPLVATVANAGRPT